MTHLASQTYVWPGASSKFWGHQGRRTGVAVTAVSNSLILGGWFAKVFKNGDKRLEGRGKGG